MEVLTAKTAGFCFGVKRAVDCVYEQVERSNKPIYTYGPIIHNEEVVKDLESKGVRVIESEEELKQLEDGIVIIRSHGVAKHIYDLIEDKGLTLVDATCPFVKKIHKIVSGESARGRQVVIAGSSHHPEVEGILGWCDAGAIVVENEENAENLDISPKIPLILVSQTTFNHNKFQDIVAKMKNKGYDINVVNTICNATHERQVEASDIASKVDGMIVVGGKNSSNTQKLFEICHRECENTCFVQTVADLDDAWLGTVRIVGITAGASTPNNIIEEVQKHVRKF